MTDLARLAGEARHLFANALAQSSISSAMSRRIGMEGRSLLIRGEGGTGNQAEGMARAAGTSADSRKQDRLIDLDRYASVSVIALGKAAIPMLEELLTRLPSGLQLTGVCSGASLPRNPRHGIRYFAGGHPTPNPDSLASARAALDLLQHNGRDCFNFFLISGGGSAMFDAPLDPDISIEEMAEFHRVLVGSGAAIGEINVLRKHFSAVKGGRLAVAANGAGWHSLLVSDVPKGQLDALASGPTLPDSSTREQCRQILSRYQLLSRFPASVQRFFADPELPETPKRSDFESTAESGSLTVLLSNAELIEAAGQMARTGGWSVTSDNTCDDWDYREAAKYLLQRLEELSDAGRRVCLLSGGELRVRLENNAGAGGRNQQFAMACALELGRSSSDRRVIVLSAGSDGVDGVSPAAGAVADATTVSRAAARGFDAEAALRDFNCYPLFHALGDTIVTGPTGNNLRDLRILLSA